MGPEAVAAIDAAANSAQPILVSLITSWELGLLEARKRVPMSRPAKAAFEAFVNLPGIEMQSLTAGILVDSSFLPDVPPNDPADRILIATARAFDLTIVTRDRHILEYAAAGHVRALAC